VKRKEGCSVFLRRLKILHKILAVIVAGIIISSIFAITAVLVGKNETKTLESIYSKNVTPLDNLRKIQLMFRELEFRMTGVQADVVAAIGSGTHLEQSIKKLDVAWSEIKNALKDYPLSDDAQKAIQTYERGYKNFKHNIVPKLMQAYFDNDPESVPDLYDEWLDYKPVIMKSIDRLADILKDSVKEHYETTQSTVSKMNIFIIIVAVFTIGFFATFAFFIVRSIKGPINTVVEAAEQVAGGDLTHTINVNTEDEMGYMAMRLNRMIDNLGSAFHKIIIAVENISSNTESLSNLSEKLLKGAKEQSEKGEQIAVASTEMAQTIVDVAKNTSDASDAAKESYDTATSGKEIVQQAIESITRLTGSVSEASATIHKLGASLKEIGEIVSVIQDIASQTNLLALNAAIEAARSGEYGRGFAVVADEVKKLAERTANATDEISAKISTIQAESEESISTMEKGRILAEESVEKATKAGEALQKIVESSDKVMDMVQRVAAATEEQSSASEEVSRNMEHISDIIKEHFKLAEEVERSAVNLAGLAQGVLVQTTFFKIKDNIDTHPKDNKEYDGTPEIKSTDIAPEHAIS
jgi:methyl-accepting chemotaxis protein